MPDSNAILLVSCQDRPGLVAEVAGFMHQQGCNITRVDQSVDVEHGAFRMRMAIEKGEPDLDRSTFLEALSRLCERHGMASTLHFGEERSRLAILCTREPHCLHDILQRHESGELECEIPIVISNHETLRPTAEFFGIPFLHIPVDPATRAESEGRLQSALEEHGIDLMVLARYMQVLSPEFVEGWRNRIINIHHSFLPAFAGASPYRQAHERGVKLIGATAHYVTAELDAGPIISQQVIDCSHRDGVVELTRKGRDVERTTLARAVRCHLDRKLLVQGDQVVVFE
ncbi:MAG: formyltetrahydrofolate deformylase [Phycisphaerales bacterium]|nr:formyltetrahydrofolate deformylase [Phycisphaerales bacterium]